ncbi:ABC transporter ATP-binding protein [Streptococcus pneumoniae]|nr:ABC transporter ATP-binding protein [Streptococcus pneumoniae]
MFWNLVRYEFKNVNKWYLALYAAVLVLSALIGIQAQTYNNLPVKENQPVLLIFLATVFGGLMITLGISTIFLIIKRFKGSVYDRQGYLTLTLPVSEHHIITTKLIGAFIWSLISTAVLLLCIYIILLSTNYNEVQLSTLLSFVGEHFTGFGLTVLSFLLSTISFILCIYLAISIGQLFNEYRTALAVAAYIGIRIVIGIIEVFFNTSTNFYVNSLAGFNDNFYMGAGIAIVEELIYIAIFYLGTYYILRNKVNLL